MSPEKEKELRQGFTDRFGAVTVLGESRNKEIADHFVSELSRLLHEERERVREGVENLAEKKKYPPVPKGKNMTEDFMFVRGYKIALKDVLALLITKP